MRISTDLIDTLLDHARRAAPLECCGLLAGRDGEILNVHTVPNAAESEYRYELDGVQQFEVTRAIVAAGLNVVGIYHSHTHAPPVPSHMDIATAAYPDLLYVIVGVRDGQERVRAFWIRDRKVEEATLVS